VAFAYVKGLNVGACGEEGLEFKLETKEEKEEKEEKDNLKAFVCDILAFGQIDTS